MSGAPIPVPFSDIGKFANDVSDSTPAELAQLILAAPEQRLLSRHQRLVSWLRSVVADRPANLEVKSKAPNGVTFNVRGKSAHDGPISGSVSF